ncbi:hypothetical protein LXA43DRAFT_1152811 [Ganoderma leucocontextum]|nr:hypothetical protein LXA43DRAFT_1152811 [Ganoderma leucocontextum]
MFSHPTNPPLSNYSEIAHAVPLEERLRIPENEPANLPIQDLPEAVDSTPDPLQHQQGHIQIDPEAIDPHLREIPQKPYVNGSGKEKAAGLRIPYFPSRFTVGTVLSGDLSEVSDADGAIPTLDGDRPVKTALHIEFRNSTYGERFQTNQRRRPSTRGAFATRAAEEIQKILFPYSLDQIKVVSIDVRSRGTVQPRIFVAADVVAP